MVVADRTAVGVASILGEAPAELPTIGEAIEALDARLNQSMEITPQDRMKMELRAAVGLAPTVAG